jgi:hypothetical protein
VLTVAPRRHEVAERRGACGHTPEGQSVQSAL